MTRWRTGTIFRCAAFVFVILFTEKRGVAMGEVIFIIVFVMVFAFLCYLITEWTNDDIDVQFVWNRNVLRISFVVAFIIWIIKVIKTYQLFEMDYSALVVIMVSLVWIINFSLTKLFHKRFSREKRRWYLSDPMVPMQGKRFPTISIIVIFGLPVFLIYDIWYLISSYFL